MSGDRGDVRVEHIAAERSVPLDTRTGQTSGLSDLETTHCHVNTRPHKIHKYHFQNNVKSDILGTVQTDGRRKQIKEILEKTVTVCLKGREN